MNFTLFLENQDTHIHTIWRETFGQLTHFILESKLRFWAVLNSYLSSVQSALHCIDIGKY